ncbi:hypothetical protein ACFQHN_08800 [Natrialbaceae archaeon GCM10025896]
MWAITRNEHVSDRIVTFLDGAEKTIHFLTANDVAVDERTYHGLRRAAERGVDVCVEVPGRNERARPRGRLGRACGI